MDVLSSVLRAAQIGSPVLCQSELVAPWGLDIDTGTKAAVHVVHRGVCWLRVEGEEPMRLVSGDVVLVGHGVRHAISDAPDSPLHPWEGELAARQRPPGVEAGETTVLLCAAYQFEPGDRHPLLGLLPRSLRLNVAGAGDELGTVVRLLMSESRAPQPGAGIVVPRLVDTLFILVMREWLMRRPSPAAGWFAALGDAQVGRALALMHEAPARPWTVEGLAAEVALSRAAFARRFAGLVGEGPLTYLTRWRMGLARQLLRTTRLPLEQVALAVGYDSAAAFGKAFRRHGNESPGRYRGRWPAG